jgi:hypothetical protein
MDTLALLCNLHADGPATLQRLRRAGCESLAALRLLDPPSLAERLEWSQRMAERFLREAELLSERVEPEEDAAQPDEPEFELESTLVEELDGDDDEAESETDDEGLEPEDAEEPAGFAPPIQRVEAVLGAWRELDRIAPPADPDEFVLPRPAPLPDLELASARIEGLSPRLVARLAELGVRTLRELAGANPLELSRTIPLGFTRLKHLSFLAARELERIPSAPSAAPVLLETERARPSEPSETAGPFA